MKPYTVGYIKSLRRPSLQKLIREAGYTLREIGRLKQPPCSHVNIVRTIRGQGASAPVWEQLAWCLNHPKNTTNGERQAATSRRLGPSGPHLLAGSKRRSL